YNRYKRPTYLAGCGPGAGPSVDCAAIDQAWCPTSAWSAEKWQAADHYPDPQDGRTPPAPQSAASPAQTRQRESLSGFRLGLCQGLVGPADTWADARTSAAE